MKQVSKQKLPYFFYFSYKHDLLQNNTIVDRRMNICRSEICSFLER